MFKVFRDAFHIQDLRRKILFTLFIIIIFRVGAAIPVPFLDGDELAKLTFGGGNILGYLDVLSGGGLSGATIFALSVSPYINASIIMQLLGVAIPALGRMQKEGEEGRKKIAQITRYVTVLLGLLMGTAYYFMLFQAKDANGNSLDIVKYTIGRHGFSGWFAFVTIVLVFAAGSALMMWLGEQINEKGIGNGISILLFAGIVSRGPAAVRALYAYWEAARKAGLVKYYFLVPAVVVLFILLVAFIVLMDNAERRVPVQYAKRIVGRKMYGGQSTHIPIKVNMSGVLPIIFASTFISFPGMIMDFINPKEGSVLNSIRRLFAYTSPLYAVFYFLLIIAFSYFYVTIQYDPVEIANNLRKNNGTIPGIRPGTPTAEFLSKIIYKITLVGALFLGFIAILPIILATVGGMGGLALGGTSILILVGVALETVKQIESQMLMRHYKGFLE